MSYRNIRWIFSIAFVTLFMSSASFASFNLMGGGSSGPGVGAVAGSPSLLVGGEITLNAFDVVELGTFYDHNINPATSFNLFGLVTRIGLGPLSGLFIDAKLGASTLNPGVGAGAGLGYRINKTLGVRVGPRITTGLAGAQVLGDAGLMIYL